MASGVDGTWPPVDTYAASAPDTDPAPAIADAAAPPPPKFANELKSVVGNLDICTIMFSTIRRKQDSAFMSPAG
jgi:hypothetical protein